MISSSSSSSGGSTSSIVVVVSQSAREKGWSRGLPGLNAIQSHLSAEEGQGDKARPRQEQAAGFKRHHASPVRGPLDRKGGKG